MLDYIEIPFWDENSVTKQKLRFYGQSLYRDQHVTVKV